MSAASVRCPAKVNLGLRVLGKRADGFHEIVTVFQAIDLWDELHGWIAPELTLEVDDPAVPADASNLVLRAARCLARRARGAGARLRLEKSIPVAAGLAGGSSDAAGALVLLNRLWRLELDTGALAEAAHEIGSDVAFFLDGGTALGTGRGERVAPLPSCAGTPLLLGCPPYGLSTPEVYSRLGAPLTPPGSDVTVAAFFVKLAEGNDFALATNDLEAPAFAMRGELARFRDELVREGARPALLSGSGSTVFGMFRAEADLESAAARLRSAFPTWTLRATRTIASGVRLETGGAGPAGS